MPGGKGRRGTSRVIALVSVLAVLLTTLTAYGVGGEAQAAERSDFERHWAARHIDHWLKSGWIRGYEDGAFRPNRAITRAEFVTLANRALGSGQVGQEPGGVSHVPFSDVEPGDWYAPEVGRAYAAGWVSGYGDGTFRPHAPVSRLEAAVLLAAIKGETSDGTATAVRCADDDQIPAWAKGAVHVALANEWMPTYPDGTFRPTARVTRADAIVMFDRLLGNGISGADMVLRNGVVYTVDEQGTIAEAVAVEGGRIVYVGSDAGVAKFIGVGTQVVDLAGKMVLPGMIDGHLHAPGTTLAELYSINLNGILREDETMATIQRFIAEHSDFPAYYGSGFSIGAFSGDEVSRGPRKERLDEICPDKPVTITSYDGHITWANSKALAAAGITEDTPNPPGGIIEKDPQTGELWGTLKEAAQGLVPEQEFTPAQRVQALRAFQDMLHSFGYTGVMSISGSAPTCLADYQALESQGELRLRVRGSLTVDPQADLAAQFAELKRLRDAYGSDLIEVATAKFFADGVVEGVTAYLLEPYTAEAGKGADYRGEFLWDMDKLREAFRMANSESFQIHVHSIGDASTRNVLDALEYAKLNAPQGDYRNTITHLQLVAPEDIPRFKELGVVASTQPYWHLKEPEWWEVVDYPLLGERAEHEYPLQSFLKAGVVVASSSDHSVTPTPNPMWAIEAGVTRNLNCPEYYGVEDITDPEDPKWLLDEDERASLADMIKSFTTNGAYQTFQEREVGSIEVGKYADLVILDRDLTKVAPLAIDGVKVLKTIFNGEVVYDAGVAK